MLYGWSDSCSMIFKRQTNYLDTRTIKTQLWTLFKWSAEWVQMSLLQSNQLFTIFWNADFKGCVSDPLVFLYLLFWNRVIPTLRNSFFSWTRAAFPQMQKQWPWNTGWRPRVIPTIQSHTEHCNEWLLRKDKKTTSVGKDVKSREALYTVGKSVN